MAEKETSGGGFILIVEDDRGTSEMEAQRLGPLGLEIRRSSTPDETVNLLRSARPELVVLDYSLPGMNALQLITRLKDEAVPVPPFILVTGRGDEAVAVESMKAGALDYIVKDAAFLENLLPTAKKALEKAALQLKLKKAEEGLRKNLRLYNFLAHVNLAAAREKDKSRLFTEICSIAVNSGGFRMAWIGVPDRDIDRVSPACSAGFVDGYLDSARLTLSEGPASKGPTATAIATGRIAKVADISTDPVMEPWREKALQRGYRSSASIPLKTNGITVAVLSLYSSEFDFFTEEEQKLLAEIEGDLSLALDAISSEEKRAASQAALERTASQLAHVMEVNPVIIFTLRSSGGRLIPEWVSGDTQGVLGYDTLEILAPDWLEKVLHPQDRARVLAGQASMPGKDGLAQDFRIKNKTGSYTWVHCQTKPVHGTQGVLISSWTDITRLKESEARFQELFKEAPIGYHSLDADGNLLAVNNTWCRTFGREEKDVLGRNFSEFLAPRSRAAFKESFPILKSTGAVEGVEYDIVRGDGSICRVSFTARVAHHQDGTFKQTHCVFTEIKISGKKDDPTLKK
ncbi:MAG: GAF domain-containing protein [Elusimicrobiota bacterium]|nr:GAF domain-containing protein [Elusimicrobiota bacterium]